MKARRLISKAVRQAELSNDFRERVGCIITDKQGRVISKGFNKRKTHPLQDKISNQVGRQHKTFLHAEIDALIKHRGKSEAHTAYVARIKKSGDTAMAKPCMVCYAALEEAGITQVVYTTNKGEGHYDDLEL